MMYLCYDTALNEEYTLIKLLQRYPACISLFKGTDDEDIWDAAPYLFEVTDNFYDLRKDELIQLDHCILFETNESKEDICQFLHYYMYHKIREKTVYLRIWDARVLVKQLIAWEEQERVKFFDFFKAVYTEQENKEWMDKWQLARFNKPAAVPVLKTALLLPIQTDSNDVVAESAVMKSAGVVSELVNTEKPADTVDQQPPKRRRFFIE